VSAVLASIPSPPTGVYRVGPLTIHMYGLMLLLAIAAAIWLTGRRWVEWGGDWDLVYRVAIWGVIFGIVGARIYHLITSWNQDAAIHAHWYGPFAVWSGGLGIWGAIPFGVAAGAWVVRRSGNSIRLFMDAVAPGLLLAQGIGRWGNYWNQELYGKHTTLPWALEIHGKGAANEFHPTFLYEFTWDVLAVLALLWIDRSSHFAGQRLNFWVSLACFIVSVAFFVWWQFLRTPSEERPQVKKARPIPKGPTMAVPRGRVRQRG